MDLVTKEKWDHAAAAFDMMSAYGPEKRWAPRKRELFSKMYGKVLFLAVGTGLDIQFFPPAQNITGIDISTKMLEKAQPRAAQYQGELELLEMDVHELTFADSTFDQAFTSCTFCSVPDPIRGLEALKRVLKPGGTVTILEITPMGNGPVGRLFRLYFGRVVPLLGRLVTGHPFAYRYLPESVQRFRDAEGLAQLLSENGFDDVNFTRLGMGSVALHHGVRSP